VSVNRRKSSSAKETVMSELELTPTAPAPAKRSLLRQIFRPKDIGFYLMIVLAWIGAVYTQTMR
jgi:hypothetical protein